MNSLSECPITSASAPANPAVLDPNKREIPRKPLLPLFFFLLLLRFRPLSPCYNARCVLYPIVRTTRLQYPLLPGKGRKPYVGGEIIRIVFFVFFRQPRQQRWSLRSRTSRLCMCVFSLRWPFSAPPPPPRGLY